MKIVDLHCDTFSRMEERDLTDFENNDLHINLSKLKEGQSLLQVFALFDNKEKYNYDIEKFNKLIDFAFNIINNNKNNLNLVKEYKNIKKDEQNIIVSVEDIGSINNDLSNLKYYYERGIRLCNLTWNYENCIGFPNGIEGYNKGLKSFGKEVIEYMNELGMIIDVSHLNDKGFMDVCDISKSPFIASHSSSRELCSNVRNLDDKMIKMIADRGGIIGVNFYSLFLENVDRAFEKKINEYKQKKEYKKLDDMLYKTLSKNESIVKHINHIKNVGGENIIAFGSDFDGISCNLEMQDFRGIQGLIPCLEKAGFNYIQIEKLYYKNALNFFKEML